MNPQQKIAVEHRDGPLLVLAGAGSGKTTVVTRRIARMLDQGVAAKRILAMTFTNKAAGEMQERVARLVGKKAQELTISTFHSFGLRVLRAEAKALGFVDGKFAIFDTADQTSAVREILRGLRADRRWDVYAILARISKAKNEFVSPEAFSARGGDDYDEVTQWVYPRYVSALKAFRAFDFDDLVCEVANLFERRDDVLKRWRSRYHYLMVDEYQDTNHAQLRLVHLLGDEHQNVCVVGDDDQAIYAWRGADVRNILEFEEHFPRAQVVKLERNYRSSETILAVANAVIHASTGRRHGKTLMSNHPGGDKVQVVVAHDHEIEASFVADEMRRFLDSGEHKPADMAVLYRSNSQAEPMETALRQRTIPYRVVGGTQFYERKEVKDLLAYLRVVAIRNDEISLRRIINYPSRGVGEVAIGKLESYALANDLPLWSAVQAAASVPGMTSAAVEGCAQLVAVIQGASAKLQAGEPSAVVGRWISEAVKLEADIAAASGSNEIAQRRKGNLDAFYRILERHDQQPQRASLTSLLQVLSLNTEEESEEPGNVVTLSTMHGAKGLEFKIVFVVGLEEGLLPHARTTEGKSTDVAPQDIEEERRLFYVAITRAMRRLYLTRTRHRSMRGRSTARIGSRFLTSIPDSLIEVREVNSAASPTTNEFKEGIAGILAALNGI